MMQYLSMKDKPLLMVEWQTWVRIGLAVVGIVVVAIGFWKSRKL